MAVAHGDDVVTDTKTPTAAEKARAKLASGDRTRNVSRKAPDGAPELPNGLTVIDGGGQRELNELRSVLVADVARTPTPPIRSYPTGFTELDARIGGGISTRQVSVVLAPPGAGKTALAVDLSIRIARTIPVLYASTELESHELMARVAGNVLDRPWSAIVRGNVPNEWLVEATEGLAIRMLGSMDLPLVGTEALTLIESEARAMAAAADGVSPLIVIDYLQDLARGSGERDAGRMVAELATELRRMTQRLDAPLLAISSVARTYYSPAVAAKLREVDDPTVYLAAAKQSGDVDYAAAVVMFLDADDDRSKPERTVRIAIAKSRHGETGFAGARFAGASGRWLDDASSVAAMSKSGRTEKASADKTDDDARGVLSGLRKLHGAGKAELCTKTSLRETKCGGVSKGSIPPALELLIHTKRARMLPLVRLEGGKERSREIYAPADCDCLTCRPKPKPAQPELELQEAEGLHGTSSALIRPDPPDIRPTESRADPSDPPRAPSNRAPGADQSPEFGVDTASGLMTTPDESPDVDPTTVPEPDSSAESSEPMPSDAIAELLESGIAPAWGEEW
jgi:DnaB-like helicase C terminal domain